MMHQYLGVGQAGWEVCQYLRDDDKHEEPLQKREDSIGYS